MSQSIRLFLVLVFLFASSGQKIQAQTPRYLENPDYLRYFSTLRHGTLFIRLHDRAGIREKIEKYGTEEELRRFDRKLQEEFQQIFTAFEKSYDFGKVLFFLGSQTHLLMKREFSAMKIYDKQGKLLGFEELRIPQFLVAEFGRLNRISRGPLIPSSEPEQESTSRSTFTAFYVMDEDLNPIDRSFYLYTRMILRSKAGAVKKFNKRLRRNETMLQGKG